MQRCDPVGCVRVSTTTALIAFDEVRKPTVESTLQRVCCGQRQHSAAMKTHPGRNAAGCLYKPPGVAVAGRSRSQQRPRQTAPATSSPVRPVCLRGRRSPTARAQLPKPACGMRSSGACSPSLFLFSKEAPAAVASQRTTAGTFTAAATTKTGCLSAGPQLARPRRHHAAPAAASARDLR
jgi:hypothetical protein